MTESTSSDDVPVTMYRGSWVVVIVPGGKTVTYSPRIRPEITESTSSQDVPITVYGAVWVVEIIPEG